MDDLCIQFLAYLCVACTLFYWTFCGLQERFAGPAPRGEGQRMPSCLPAKIIVAKFNVTTIFPERTGRADGWAGPMGGPARTADGPTGPYICIVAAPQGSGRAGSCGRENCG